MAANVGSLLVTLSADAGDLSRGLQIAGRDVTNFEKKADRSIGRIGGLFASLRASASAALAGLGSGLATGIAGVGLAGVVGAIGSITSELAALKAEAARAGIPVEDFQALRYAAADSLVSVDALTDGLKEMNLRGDEFATTGKGSAAEAFQRLGFSAAQLKERLRDPVELFLEITRRLSQIEDQAARIRIADEVFGGTGGEQFVQLLGKGDDHLRDLMKTARETGDVLDQELVARVADIDREFDRLAGTISTNLKSAVVSVVAELDTLIGKLRTAMAESPNERMNATVRSALRQGGFTAKQDRQTATDALRRQLESGDTGDGLFFRDDVVREASTTVAARPVTDAPKRSGGGGGGRGAAKVDEYAKVLEQAQRRIDQLRVEAAALRMTEQAADSFRFTQDAIADAQRDGRKLTDAEIENLARLGDAYGALGEQIRQAGEARSAMEELRGATDGLLSGLASTALRGGSAADYLKEKLLSMADAVLERALAPLERSLGNLFAGGIGGGKKASGGGLIGMLFGGAFAGGFADGGRVPGGKYALVGEEGPELIKAAGAGLDVIPMGSMGRVTGAAARVPVAEGSGPATVINQSYDFRDASAQALPFIMRRLEQLERNQRAAIDGRTVDRNLRATRA